jgi:hypothetical protein
VILLISASGVARITGVSHQSPACISIFDYCFSSILDCVLELPLCVCWPLNLCSILNGSFIFSNCLISDVVFCVTFLVLSYNSLSFPLSMSNLEFIQLLRGF